MTTQGIWGVLSDCQMGDVWISIGEIFDALAEKIEILTPTRALSNGRRIIFNVIIEYIRLPKGGFTDDEIS